MGTYRKRPVEVEARQWDGSRTEGMRLVQWIRGNGRRAGLRAEPDVIEIYTLEGVMTARSGDWIIRGIEGEFYPRKPDIFTQTYEPVETGEMP